MVWQKKNHVTHTFLLFLDGCTVHPGDASRHITFFFETESTHTQNHHRPFHTIHKKPLSLSLPSLFLFVFFFFYKHPGYASSHAALIFSDNSG
mmetsp:Transcript_3990/g.9066  ORF Transcript_3990/g.9066 Transcript_3990/m.9066 type:complete len:93 (+) Transcript_3990:50-328(+)